MKDLFENTRQKMEKALQAFHHELSTLRTGRASLAVLDMVRVDYYGQPTPLSQVATLGVPESRLITVTPWEKNLIPEIERAIQKANLGLSPVNDGKLIRIPIPALDEERRRDLVKVIHKHAEESRVAVRHVRREIMDELKKREKAGVITEDESKKGANEVQKFTDEYIKKVDASAVKKEAEIMEV